MFVLEFALIGEIIHIIAILVLHYLLYFLPIINEIHEPIFYHVLTVIQRNYPVTTRKAKSVLLFSERIVMLFTVSISLSYIFGHYHLFHTLVFFVTDLAYYNICTNRTVHKFAMIQVIFRIALLLFGCSIVALLSPTCQPPNDLRILLQTNSTTNSTTDSFRVDKDSVGWVVTFRSA